MKEFTNFPLDGVKSNFDTALKSLLNDLNCQHFLHTRKKNKYEMVYHCWYSIIFFQYLIKALKEMKKHKDSYVHRFYQLCAVAIQ